MSAKFFIIAAFCTAVFLFVPQAPAFAQTTLSTSLEALIQSLQQQVAALQTQLAALLAAPALPITEIESVTEVSTLISTSSQTGTESISTEAVSLEREVSSPNSYLPGNTTVTVLSPNGGEVWRIGSPYPIRWRLNAGSSSEAFFTSILLQSVSDITGFTTDGNFRETVLIIATTTLSIDGDNRFLWTVPETVRPAASYRLYVQMNQLTYLDSPSYTGHWVYPMDESDGNVSILADEGNPATTSTVATSTAAHDSLTSLFASLWSFFENLFR